MISSPSARRARVVAGGQHHAHRGRPGGPAARPPAARPSAAPTSQGSRSSSRRIKHRLGLGIAEAAVPLDHHRAAVGGQHQPAVEQAAERAAGRGQRPHRGHEHASRAIRARPPRRPAATASRRPCRRCSGRRRRRRPPCDPPTRRAARSRAPSQSAIIETSRPGEPLLDDDAGAGLAEPASRQHVARGGLGLGLRRRDHDALARRQPVRLDHHVPRLGVDERLGRGQLLEHCRRRRWERPPPASARLANAFEPSISAAAREGPKQADPGRRGPRRPGRRRGRPRDRRPPGPRAPRPRPRPARGSRRRRSGRQVTLSPSTSSAAMPGLPGATSSCSHERACRELPGQRVLAPPRSDQE